MFNSKEVNPLVRDIRLLLHELQTAHRAVTVGEFCAAHQVVIQRLTDRVAELTTFRTPDLFDADERRDM